MQKKYCLTDLYTDLRRKKLLIHRLKFLGIKNIKNFNNFDKFVNSLNQNEKKLLLKYGLIKENKLSEKHRRNPSLRKVNVINFELTYNCNSYCPHCFQKDYRKQYKNIFLNEKFVMKLIEQFWFCGIFYNEKILSGINLTGGEVLSQDYDIFSIIEFANSKDINIRLNTNSWWGNKIDFKVSKNKFSRPLDLVKKLKKTGVNILALSFDNRIKEDKNYMSKLTNVMDACEKIGLNYQVIHQDMQQELYNKIDIIKYNYLSVVNEKTRDIGKSADNIKEKYNSDMYNIILNSECRIQGFYYPHILTVNPKGELRTCRFAVGNSWTGNLHNKSFYNIYNNFYKNKVAEKMLPENIKNTIKQYFLPFKNVYKNFKHPCTALSVIAGITEKVCKLKKTNNRRMPDTNVLTKINQEVAEQFNL